MQWNDVDEAARQYVEAKKKGTNEETREPCNPNQSGSSAGHCVGCGVWSPARDMRQGPTFGYCRDCIGARAHLGAMGFKARKRLNRGGYGNEDVRSFRSDGSEVEV